MTFDRNAADAIDPGLFDFITQVGLDREPPDKHLFHYTSTAGLSGILAAKAIFATHASFLNDTSEVQFGLNIVREELARFREIGVEDSVCDHLDRSFAGSAGYDFFVACFCESDDLVPQWRGYGADGAGYALGFPSHRLSGHGRNFLLGVNYGDAPVRIPVRRAIQHCIQKLREADAGPAEDLARAGTDAISSMMVALLLRAVASKDEVFAFEREFRLVRLVKQADRIDSKDILFRDAHGMITPYMLAELPLVGATLAMSSLRCGPSLSSEATILGAKMLLESHGLGEVPVTKSAAPLRAI
jgi:hypothetical protein